MSRPDWCPQDVWEAACGGVEVMPQRPPFKMDVQTAIARAILAERERTTKICDDEIELARQFGPHHVPIISSIRRKIVEPA